MSLKIGKRLITLALSAALLLGEASVSLAAPKANFDPAIDVVEESQVVGAYTPGKVTNVGFFYYDSPGILDKFTLGWDAVKGATGYQFRVTDDKGNEYAELTDFSSGVYNEIDYPYTDDLHISVRNFDFSKIEKSGSGYIYSKDAKGNYIYMKAATSYRVQVRAARINGSEKTYGPWSDAVSFTTEKFTLRKPSDIVYSEEADGDSYIYLSCEYRYEIEIKDSAGNQFYENVYEDSDGKTVYEYADSYDDRFIPSTSFYAFQFEKSGSSYNRKKDDKGNYIKPFVAGQSYTLRFRGVGYDENGEKKETEWTSPITIKVSKINAPSKTGSLKFNVEDHKVSWSKIFSANGYYVEIKDSDGNYYGNSKYPVSRSNEYVSKIDLDDYRQLKKNSDGTFSVVYDSEGDAIYAGQPGKTYYVRVQCYNQSNVYDYDKDEYPEQLSAWSETLTCKIPAESYASVTKVKGLRFYLNNVTNGIKWNTPDDQTGMSDISYEVEIKDTKNRYYKILDGSNLNNATTTRSYYCTEDLLTYEKLDDTYEPVINANGDNVKAFTEGETYTVRVRMSATVTKADGSTENKTGDWSDAFTFKVPGDFTEYGYNTKPGTVNGLLIKSKPDTENDFVYCPVLYWNKLDNVSFYEVEIKDSQGYTYCYYYDIINDVFIPDYYDTVSNYMDFSSVINYYGYIRKADSSISRLMDSNNAYVHPFEAGKTYTFRVRAVNGYEKKLADNAWSHEVYFAGDWSSPVSYTEPANDFKVTGLKYVKEDDDYYFFDYTANTAYSTLYYQVSTSSDFKDDSIVINWDEVTGQDIDDTYYKFVIDKKALDPEKTYYVRVVNCKNSYTSPYIKSIDKKEYAAILSTAATVSFKTTKINKIKPKDITGLKLYDEDATSFDFRFNAVLSHEDNDYYEVQISSSNDSNDNKWSVYSSKNSNSSFSISKYSLLDGTTYVRVRAYIEEYDENTGKTNKVYGKPSNVVAVNITRESTSSIGVIALSEENEYNYLFAFTGNPRINEKVYYYIADTSTFDTNNKEGSYYYSYYIEGNSTDFSNKKVSISKSSLKPGKTYYVKLRVFNPNSKTTASSYSSYSNVIKFTTSVPKAVIKETVVGKTSVKLRMAQKSYTGWISGYEFQRKSGSGKKASWKTLEKTSANVYTNSKLKAFKTYTYRVRPYYFDKLTKKLTYGDWVYTEAMTGWPGSINVKALAASKTSVKLSWNKVKGANGYEIYRLVADSSSDKVSDGNSNKYSSYQLIKTLKSGKKSYTDKKLVSGMNYSYIVKAYKKVGKKKVYISGSADVTLDFELVKIKEVISGKGKKKVTWNPVMSSKGYKIEKKDPVTGKYNLYKTIKKAKTSGYTFPATTDFENGDSYRIYAFDGKKITNYIYVFVDAFLAAPTNVKAKVSGRGITVTWNKVAGADYYRVYRTTDPTAVYDADTKSYSYSAGSEIDIYVPDAASFSGYRKLTPKEMNINSITDQQISITYNGVPNQIIYNGPQSGVKYYYFVVAYRNKPQNGYKYENGVASCFTSGCSKAASAMIKEAKPGKPVISKGVSKKKTVTLTIKGSAQADGYEIERSKKQKKGYKVIGEATGITVTYKDKYNKKKNKIKGTYYYRVRSYVYNDDGSKVYSAYSKAKKVKVK